jgi:hypothetical protein
MRLPSGCAMIAALGLGLTMAATDAFAQGVDLTGKFRCVQMCSVGLQDQPAYVTQNGSNLNLLNEAGEPSRARIDWNGHIWAESWHEGALFSSDGMMIQFDRGTIWQRDLGAPPAAVPARRIPDRVSRAPARRAAKASRSDRTASAATDATISGATTGGATTSKRISAPMPVQPAPAKPVPTAFDGDWSVVIMTQSGSCDRAYRYGVRIANGDVVYDGGGPVDLQGHVYSSGSVRVFVSGGGQQADGQGRLTRTAGTGTWHGQGSLGSCSGVWQAERRG